MKRKKYILALSRCLKDISWISVMISLWVIPSTLGFILSLAILILSNLLDIIIENGG